MARIFIDVHPDGTFTTGTYHGDPVAHAANQADGVVTYMSECLGEIEGFNIKLMRYAVSGGAGIIGERRYVGPWRYWGAFCIKQWNCWFERVEGYKRRMRIPTAQEKIDLRILHALRGGDPVGIGILKNRFRKEPVLQIYDRLASLVKSGEVIEERFHHSITGVETARYRLAQPRLTAP